MINPFAGKKPVQLEMLTDGAEDMTKAEKDEAMIETLLGEESYVKASGFSSIAGAIIDSLMMIGGKPTIVDHKFRPPRQLQARCGGRLKKNSIKQRTRLNRDERNRDRRYAKHAQQFGYRHEYNYANQ